MAELIEATNLSRNYVMGDQIVQALAGVDFTIQSGEFVSIVGPSGSGKSTLMNLIGGLDQGKGSLKISGQELNGMRDDDAARFRNQTIGFVFQSFNLLPRLTALENVELPLIYSGKPHKTRTEMAVALLKRVGLGERMDHRPTQLSGGQQQRVAIARALVGGPELLLADEPTGALDTRTGEEILALFHELNRDGVTIVIVTHDMEVARSAHRIIEMRDGRILSDQPASNGGARP